MEIYEVGPNTLYSAAGADTDGVPVPCEGLSTVSVQLTGTLTSVIVYFEGTIDGVNWIGIYGVNRATGAKALTATATGVYVCDVTALTTFRARLDWTSGSITAVARGSSSPTSSFLESDSASGGTPAKVAVTAKSSTTGDTEIDAATAGADTMSNTSNRLAVTSRLNIFNGATWDRLRSVVGDAMAAIGLQAIVPMLWNGTTYDRPPGNTSGAYVQGPGASGATSVGNPVAVGGKYNSTLPTLTNGQRSDFQQGTRGSQNVTLFGQDSSTPVATDTTNADGKNNNLALVTENHNYLYNNSNYDRARNNHEVTVLASAARSADTNSADQPNYNARGVVVSIDITVLGSTNLTITVTYKDSLSGKYVTILASAALIATGTYTLVVYPSATPASNLVANFPLPRFWRVQSVRGGTPGTDTFSVSSNYIN